MAHLIEGAGFEVLTSSAMGKDPLAAVLEIQRLRTLPDTVGPEMALLVAGLNPSLHAADMGVGFGRPGNRFWPAALAAGLVSVDRDPMSALDDHGVGMTDLVKRATRRADELLTEEYQAGLTRLEWFVRAGPTHGRVRCRPERVASRG